MRRRTKTTITAICQVLLALVLTAVLAVIFQSSSAPRPRTLHILTTNDVHGHYFDSSYVGNRHNRSLQNVKWYVDSVRTADGAENVLLIDAGDCLQGDNASYYFNYVNTTAPHIYPRIAKYMGYDVLVVGNHDIETGHPIYDRVAAQLKKLRIPWLAGNTPTPSGKPYFREYCVIKRAGMKILVLGYTNANMKSWLGEEIWSGMDFQELAPMVQGRVDALRAKVQPDIVIVAAHTGTGAGDGKSLESEGLDMMRSLRGVDFLICAHDHAQTVVKTDSICLINAGSKANYLGHGTVTLQKDGRKTVGKVLDASLIRVRWDNVDQAMVDKFHPDFQEVKDFTCCKVGELMMPLITREAYSGPCDYITLIHTVQLKATGANISFAAPLTFNGVVKAGTLVFDDMFTIYPYENQLFTMNLTGRQIKDCLEFSYNNWIGGSDGHVLSISARPDSRTGAQKWSFKNRTYNFDSAAGINYTVDATAPYGSRISIESMADGSPFSLEKTYSVALTSYRANGGGDILVKGAGIPKAQLESLISGKYPEIRNLIYNFIKENKVVDRRSLDNPQLIGSWSFLPQAAREQISEDLKLVF